MNAEFEAWITEIERLYTDEGVDFDRPDPSFPAEYRAFFKDWLSGKTHLHRSLRQ